MISANKRNLEVTFPYINGQDINSHPQQLPSRWIINFWNWSLEKAESYAEPMMIVRKKVYPERMEKKGSYKKQWWLYARRQMTMFESIEPFNKVLVCGQVSKYLSFTFLPNGYVFDQKVIVFCFENNTQFTILQSNLHGEWVWRYSSTMRNAGISYSPTDVFHTFPFPNPEPGTLNPELETIGETYHEHRRQIMLARQEGLTDTYNRFHNPEETAADIIKLRELHVQMDQAVAAAYGWQDLALEHGFHPTTQGLRYTISESARREVLGRLLALNHQRYAEEVALGLHDKKKGSKRKGLAGEEDEGDEIGGQLSLF